jgi:hypothetical protein
MSSNWDRQAFDRSALQPLIVVSEALNRATQHLDIGTATARERLRG